MMGETRQQEPRDFPTEMADLEEKTINQILDICERNLLGASGDIVSVTALFAAHIVTCVCNTMENRGEEPTEDLPWT